MQCVFKYEVPVGDVIGLDLPKLSKIVHVGLQSVPTMWVHIGQATKPTVTRSFQAFATGEPIPAGWVYVGTAQNASSSVFVWHIFERVRP